MPTARATPDVVATESLKSPTHGVANQSGTNRAAQAVVLDLDLDPLVETLTARTTGADVALEVRRVVE